MTQLAKYDIHEAPTTPDWVPVVLTTPTSSAFRWLPYLLGGLGIGLIVPALVIASGFAVDLSYYGGGWYAAAVLLAAGYLGLLVGAVVVHLWETK